MNKNGFTLVEMLLVVVLIAIISLITLPNIMDMLKESKETKYEKLYETVKENLKLYRIDHSKDLVWINNSLTISYNVLKTSNADLDLGDCSTTKLEIIRTPKDTLGDTSYTYTYNVCLVCPDGKSNVTYGECN